MQVHLTVGQVMKKQNMIKIVNPIMGILMLNQFITGFFHKQISHDTFEVLHEWGASLLLVFVILHVILNWGWIKNHFLSKRSVQNET